MNAYSEKLYETAVRIFEDAAFALVDPPEDMPEPPDGVPLIYGSVAFEGPFSGTLMAVIPEPLGRVVSANMLGIDEDDPEAESKSRDAILEMLNMICGNLLPEIAGKQAEFRIDSPVETTRDAFVSITASHDQDLISKSKFSIEGNPSEIALLLNTQP